MKDGCVNMNDELKKYLDNDENMGIRDEDIELIYKYKDTCHPFIHLNKNKPIFKEYYKEPIFKKYYNEPEKEIFYKLENGCCKSSFVCINKDDLSNGQGNRPDIRCKSIDFPSEEENSINGNLVFQRCHLIGYQLFAKKNDKDDNENSNLKRIFIGTRFMNNVMLYYENLVVTYIRETKGQVLYRVSPFFEEENKRAYGVQIEAMSINQDNNVDKDKGLPFNIFVYNKQPGIKFKYDTGKILKDESISLSEKIAGTEWSYILNKKKKKFHLKCCASVWCIKDNNNKGKLVGRWDKLTDKYRPCTICNIGTK